MGYRLKNKHTGVITLEHDYEEFENSFQLSIVDGDILHNFVYSKEKWIKVLSEKEMLNLILKDFNKLHKVGFKNIICSYLDTDMVMFNLYHTLYKSFRLSYFRDSREIYYEDCKIESDDLRASIESYLSHYRNE